MKTIYKSIITIIAVVGLLVSLAPIPVGQAAQAPQPPPGTSYIIVHALNPEGIEIASIEGVGPYSVPIYDGDALIGYSAHNEETYNKPIAISPGAHTIRVRFNGMTLEQEISVAANETKVLTFTFEREDFNIYDYIYSADLEAFQLNEGSTEESHPTTWWAVGASVWYYPAPPQQDVWAHAKLYFTGGISYSWRYYVEILSDSRRGYSYAWIRKSSGAIEIPIQRGNFDSWFVQTVEFTETLDVRIGRAYFEESYPPSNAVRIWGDPGTTLVIGASSNSAIWIGIDGHGYAVIGPSVISFVATDSGSGIFNVKFSSIPYDITGTGIKYEENQPPVASFVYLPAYPIVGQEIRFDASDSFDLDGDPLTYKWDFGGGETSTKSNPTHIYRQAGTYEVKLVVNDGKVDSFPASRYVVVKEPKIIVWVEGAEEEDYLVAPSGDSGLGWKKDPIEIEVHVQISAWDQPVEGATILFDGMERGKTDADGHLHFLFPVSAKKLTPGPFTRAVQAHWDGIEAESEEIFLYEVEKVNHKKVILRPFEVFIYNSILFASLGLPGVSTPFLTPVGRIESVFNFVIHWFQFGPLLSLDDELEVTIYKLSAPGLASAWLVSEQVYRPYSSLGPWWGVIKQGATWTGLKNEYDRAVEKGLLDRRILGFESRSPAVLYITAPDGSHAGYDPSTGELVADFPIAISEPGDEPFQLFIPQPLEGEYLLNVIGTDTGEYTLSVQALDSEGIAGQESNFTKSISENEIHSYSAIVSEEGDIIVEEIMESIPAIIDCDPDTLNLKSQGQWITCYIELPAGYDVKDIDATSILLNGLIPPELNPKYGFVKSEQSYIMDHDEDGILERMVKFDRAQVQAILSPGTAVSLTLTGKVFYNLGLADFEGEDTIRVIDPEPKGKGKK